MEFRVFYSWQGISPNATNRGFIQGELEAIVKDLKTDDSIVLDIAIDRDTAGVAGAPDIGATILDKIRTADALVADVTIVNPKTIDDRKMPNPNVLVELGYALSALGPGKIVMVMNCAFGSPEDLPFDLKQKRVVTYSLPEKAEKGPAKNEFRPKLRAGLKAIIEAHQKHVVAKTAASAPARNESVLEAIRTSRPDQGPQAKRFMELLADDLAALDPHERPGDRRQNLLNAIESARTLVDDFGRVAQSAAEMRATEAVKGIIGGLEFVLARYWLRAINGNIAVRDSDFDFFKFVGHELVTVLAAKLMATDSWALLHTLSSTQIYRDDPRYGVRHVGIADISESVHLLAESNGSSSGAKAHADLLRLRHETPPMVGGVSVDDLTAADMFLFIATHGRGDFETWIPWSARIAGRRVPRFLSATATREGSVNLATALGLSGLGAMKDRVASALALFYKSLRAEGIYYRPGAVFDPAGIVTQ